MLPSYLQYFCQHSSRYPFFAEAFLLLDVPHRVLYLVEDLTSGERVIKDAGRQGDHDTFDQVLDKLQVNIS